MVTITTVLRTFISRFLLAILILLAFPLIILMMVFPERIRYKSRLLFWGMNVVYWGVISIMRLSFIPVSYIEEDAHSAHKDPVIFVANHQSAIDAPLLGRLARGKPHIWLAREELMQWKLLRWILPRLTVVVDVNSRQKAMGSMLRLVRLVKGKDIDVMIFPEGARYPDDKMHPFYGGFVVLAKLLKRPVVPVCILGVNKVYPPDTFWMYHHPVKVIVGKPMALQENETDDAFKDRVYRWFVEQVES